MSVLRWPLAMIFLAASTASAWATDPAGYTCTFAIGAARSYDKGVFKPEKASKVVLAITGINPDQQSAALARAGAATPLRVVRAVNALHFLEVVGEGYMNITTVYDRDAKATRHPAVHSRHFGVLGQPIFAQYHGFCQAN